MDPLSERFQAIADLVGSYGFRVMTQAGQSDGTDWEVRFRLAVESPHFQPPTHNWAAPTEEALIALLRRRLPERAAEEWRQYAFALEARR